MTDTQKEGVDASARSSAATEAENSGRGLNGTIRQQDTINPGNDPRSSKR